LGLLTLAMMGALPAVAQFDSLNVALRSNLTLADFGQGDANGNDCWGYVSGSGREYALMGLEKGLAIVEITDPVNPVIVGRVNHTASLWGDVKVFGDYCYVVNESGGGMQVIDLSQIDSGIVPLPTVISQGGLSTAHNVALNTDSGYVYTCGANGHQGIAAYDLSNPAAPVFAGAYDAQYTHDAVIVSYTSGTYVGKEVAFCFNGGNGLTIVDVTNKASMTPFSTSTNYPGRQYCHQGWPSDDLQYLYINDELDELNGTTPTTRTLIFDISDLSGPTLANTFTTGLTAIDHNLYVAGTLIYEANYRSGLRILDATDPVNLSEVAYFDTYPGSDAADFTGAWSVYPYFPSGNVIVSDINRGLFVLDPNPPLPLLTFTFPDGLPVTLDPDGAVIRVEVGGQNGGVPQSGTGMLHYDTGGGFAGVAMTEVSPNVYDAIFPAVPCGATVTYYFEAETTTAETNTSPPDAPTIAYSAISAVGAATILTDDAETDPGWAVDPDNDDDATTGVWNRMDPEGTSAQTENDHTPGGTDCWVTDGLAGSGLGDRDVDNGKTTLMSPQIDMDGLVDPRISYWRWYSNDQGGSPNADTFLIDISDDDGSSWTNVEAIGPGGPDTSGGWIFHELRVNDFASLTSTVRLRFVASDEGSGSIVEAAIDDLSVTDLICAGCAEDVSGDGEVNITDLGAVLANFGTTSGAAHEDGDIDGDGDVDITDLGLLLAAFGTSCL
jgi:choice-of-anchor B domain-containing protein